jgi:L-amino acid N-acyltransferase YncA
MADASAATSLLNAIIQIGGTTALQVPLSTDEMLEWFLAGPDVCCCHVADQAGRVIGFQTVGRYGELPDSWGDMATFAAADAMRKGIGSALFQATLAKARKLGLSHLNATIRADNTVGLAYYSRMGFVDYHVDLAVPLADGTPVDRISKQLVL